MYLNKFKKFLFASIFSALIMSIYSTIDALCIGQAEGEAGAAAIAVGIPVWTLIYSSGLLCGIGGATLLTLYRGKGDYNKSNQIFTSSFILSIIVCLILIIVLSIFQRPLLILFGAREEHVLELILKYTFWLKIGLPFFFFSQYLSVIVRNDNNPYLSTLAVILGGVINACLDPVLVFYAKLNIFGAGLATCIGQVVSVLVLVTHFFTRKRNVKFIKPNNILKDFINIFVVGFSSFILDICMGIMTMIFNNQINRYNELTLATAYLAVYGVIINMHTLTQALGYAVGQASQPLLSEAKGEDNKIGLKSYFKYGSVTSFIFGIGIFVLLELISPYLLNIFANSYQGSLAFDLGVRVERIYYSCFIFMIFNVYSIYYFNSIMKQKTALIVSILRGLVFPILYLFILPLINFDFIWMSILFTEISVTLVSFGLIIYFKKVKKDESK